jgi:hypothetical protein
MRESERQGRIEFGASFELVRVVVFAILQPRTGKVPVGHEKHLRGWPGRLRVTVLVI